MATCDGLTAAVGARYAAGTRADRGRILDEFTAVTGFHRRHAMRALRAEGARPVSGPRPGCRVYDDPVREALVVLWEASGRICGKRLRPMVPVLVESMDRHGHLQLAAEVRAWPLKMSPATLDRAMKQAKGLTGEGPRRRSSPTALRRSIPVRTFDGWSNPAPGYVEADLVAHGGPTAKGSFVQTLPLTDIATDWTECAPLLVREQTLLTEVVSKVRKLMPFVLPGFDSDNDGVFLKETVRDYCAAGNIEFTRCRPCHKNDQAWVKQKNGAVVWHAVGYRRLDGLEAAAGLARLRGSLRLFVNNFQPSFRLASKARDGAKAKKRYHPPAAPYQRLLADPRTSDEARRWVEAVHGTLDPVRLLRQIRAAQQRLVAIADGNAAGMGAPSTAPTLEQFLAGLRTAWREGEVRPTAQPKAKVTRERRRPDPLIRVTALLHG